MISAPIMKFNINRLAMKVKNLK